MKNILSPFSIALFIVSSMFFLAFFLSSCTSAEQIKGDREYAQYNYSRAVDHYKKSLTKKNDPKVRLRLADAYIQNNLTQDAEDQFRQIPFLPQDAQLKFARILMINKHYPEARKVVQRNLRANPGNEEFKTLLSSLDSMAVYVNSEPEFEVHRLPAPINQQGSNFGATYFANGIIFASERPEGKKNWEAGWTGASFLDLYFAECTGSNNWSQPVPLTGKVNSPYHEGIASFNPNENTIFFTRNDFYQGRKGKDNENVNHLQLYFASLEAGNWNNVQPFPYNGDDFSTGQPSLANDGTTLYFISDQPGGYGGTDIYVCLYENGTFSAPKNLGPEVNTFGDEMFPFIHPNGTMYFASNGHPGMGGLDLFKTQFESGSWSSPENMNAPLNSSRDDFALILDQDQQTGYLSSNRNTKGGVDELFSFSELKPALKLNGIAVNQLTREPLPGAKIELEEIETGKTLTAYAGPLGEFSFSILTDRNYRLVGSKELFKPAKKEISTVDVDAPIRTILELEPIEVQLDGIVVNKTTGKPIQGANVELTDHADQSTRTVVSGPDGKFNFPLQPGSVYSLHSSKKRFTGGYASVSTVDVTSSETFFRKLAMDSLILNKPIVLENIYYDFDKDNIRTDAALELDKLYKVLIENPSINIELSSHTDSRGNDAYNLDLSDRRAHSAVQYLISKGIDRNRMTARGYGESRLVNECANGVQCSEEDHQLNRRTEFKVTSFSDVADISK